MILLPIVISFLFSVILVFLLRKFGVAYGFFDDPTGDILKIHKTPIPYLGGAAIFIVFSTLLLSFAYYKEFLGREIGGILIVGLIIFSLGLWDDLKWKHISTIKPRLKLVLMVSAGIVAALILFASGIFMEIIPPAGVIIPLTFFYILGSINAINLQDGLDGLAGGVVAISLVGFATVFYALGYDAALLISLVCLGSILGFLFFNFPPAKIFMGDSGAYFLGFILAIMAFYLSKPYDSKSFLGPILIIGLPVFDTALTTLRRFFSKKPLFLGDRDHSFDKLYRATKSVSTTILTSYFIQALSVGIGIFILL